MVTNHMEIIAWQCAVDSIFRLMHVAWSNNGVVNIKEEMRLIWLLEPQAGKRKDELAKIHDQCPDDQAQQMSYLIIREGCHVLASKATWYVQYSKRKAHSKLNEARLLALNDRFSRDAVIYACQKLSADEQFDFMTYLKGIQPNAPHEPGQPPVASRVDITSLLERLDAEQPEQRPAILTAAAWEAIALISGVNLDNESVDQTSLPAFLRVDPDLPPSVLLCDGKWNRKAPASARWRSGWLRAKHRKATMRVLRRRAKWKQHRTRMKKRPPDGDTRTTAAKPPTTTNGVPQLQTDLGM